MTKQTGGPRFWLGMGAYISTYPVNKPNYDELLLGSVLAGPPKEKKEADSASSHVAPLRARESASAKAKSNIRIRSRFSEAKASSPQGSKFKVILIQEGLGNLGDCFFYTKECLKNAPSLFEGVKCFADHPDAIEEQTRPERSTRDILGHFENVEYLEAEGRGMLTAELCVIGDPSFDWARALLANAVDYAQKYQESEFVGLSINAQGEAGQVPLSEFIKGQFAPGIMDKLQKAVGEGISEVRPVTALKEAISCDLVTEAGAGGKILKMIENERKPAMAKKKDGMKEMDKKEGMEGKQEGEEGKASKETHQTAEGQGEGDDDGHDDAEQDKALIAKMIKQYLGDEHEADEATHEMAKEALEAYGSECKDKEEAYEKAGMHLKMAAKMGKAMASKKEKKEGVETKAHEGSDAGGSDGDSADSDGKDHKESDGYKAKYLAARAENARLSESLKKFELEGHLETKLKESKFPMAVTKKFREALGTPKTKGEIDQAFKIFSAAYTGETTEAVDGFASFVLPEKTKTSFTESGEGKKESFSNCVD